MADSHGKWMSWEEIADIGRERLEELERVVKDPTLKTTIRVLHEHRVFREALEKIAKVEISPTDVGGWKSRHEAAEVAQKALEVVKNARNDRVRNS